MSCSSISSIKLLVFLLVNFHGVCQVDHCNNLVNFNLSQYPIFVNEFPQFVLAVFRLELCFVLFIFFKRNSKLALNCAHLFRSITVIRHISKPSLQCSL